MANRNLVVIGASAGGVEALRALVKDLPADLAATVLIVLHVPPTPRSVLPEILQRASGLTVRHAVDGEPLAPGTVLVAPPDSHLLVHRDRVRLSRGARENGSRPAVDPLFRSAARWYGPRLISVILTGTLDDGTSGTLAVRMAGGTTMAQSPEEAPSPSMPLSAIENVGVDYVAPLAELATRVAELVKRPLEDAGAHVPDLAERPLEDEDMAPMALVHPKGPASSFTCPECHGALWELKDESLVRYRCRTGHAFAPESLFAFQAEHVEEALWTALRALEESSALAEHLAQRVGALASGDMAKRYAERATDARQQALAIRETLAMFASRHGRP